MGQRKDVDNVIGNLEWLLNYVASVCLSAPVRHLTNIPLFQIGQLPFFDKLILENPMRLLLAKWGFSSSASPLPSLLVIACLPDLIRRISETRSLMRSNVDGISFRGFLKPTSKISSSWQRSRSRFDGSQLVYWIRHCSYYSTGNFRLSGEESSGYERSTQ